MSRLTHIQKYIRISLAMAATILSSTFSTNALAAVLLEDAQLVSRANAYAQAAPQPKTFVVTSSGRYVLQVSDIGFPAPLTAVDVVITRGVETVARLSRVGSMEFDAVAGTYSIQVLGTTATAGTASVSIASNTGGTALLNFETGIVSAPSAAPTTRSSVATKVAVTTAGNYQVTLTDRVFPAALSSVDLMLLSQDGTPVARICKPVKPGICDSAVLNVVLNVGQYDLFLTANAAAVSQAGLYSVDIRSGASNVIYAVTNPVGVLTAHSVVNFPAADQYSLDLRDLQFPAALADVKAAIAQGSNLLVTVSGGSAQSFTAAGDAVLYTIGTPSAPTGVGTFGVSLSRGTKTVFSDVRAANGTAPDGARAFAYSISVPSDGQYRIQVKDFNFPTSISSLQFLFTQSAATLASQAGSGTTTVPAKSGTLVVIAVANILRLTDTGLFGIAIDAQPSGQKIFETTQGVGDLFHSRTLTVTSARSLDVSVRDVGFPAAFADLAFAVTRGTTLVGQIFGGGKFSFSATPGDYSLSLVARTDVTANYGMYGLKIEDTPPPPTVTFSATSLSVVPNATASIGWTTVGATSCVASGALSGAQPTSATAVTVGPLSADATVNLTCNGVGGTSSAALKINVSATEEQKGGGSVESTLLLMLLLLASVRLVHRKLR